MEIKLEHKFIYQCYDLGVLFDCCVTLGTYTKRLEVQSKTRIDIDPDKYKGNGFELFAEALIKLSPIDNRIGITSYSLVTNGDTGVDGYGFGSNGKPATVQVKYRNNMDTLLTANIDGLSNFITASQNKYKVDINGTMNMLVITNAKGLHHFTKDEMLYRKVRCLGNSYLKMLVDNNIPFWNYFSQLCPRIKK